VREVDDHRRLGAGAVKSRPSRSPARCPSLPGIEHPGLPSLADQCQQLSGEIERLRALLHQRGIEPEDKSA